MIRRIFIDLDDVCNMFTMYALRSVGCSVRLDYADYPAECGYDIVAAANYLLNAPRYTINAFWDAIARDMWATIPRSTIFPWVVDVAESLVGRENVCIATSPTKDPDCLAGKLEWIHRNMPDWMWRQYSITPRKYLLARPDSLLIDDNQENIHKFETHGGHGIVVPRPWNSLSGRDPLDHVRNELRRLFHLSVTDELYAISKEISEVGCKKLVPATT
jgi:hypothetical protein